MNQSRQIFTIVLLIITMVPFGFNPCISQNRIQIDEELLLNSLEILSHDSMEGRRFGSAGNHKAQQFIAQRFTELGIAPVLSDGYRQPFSQIFSGRRRQRMFPVADPGNDFSNVPDTTLYGANILAQIKGQSDKVIIITAHFDHLGIREGEIYNGADDDASGTAALFAIAKYFNARHPRHTLILAALDGEEVGSPGCEYLVDNFPVPLEKVILNINMDMIAHNESNELYASGLYHYPALKAPLESIESPINLQLGHDKPDDPKMDDWTNSSDHRVFHQKHIPFIYFGVEDHKDYHQSTDTFENINPEFYVESVKVIIQAIEGYDISLD